MDSRYKPNNVAPELRPVFDRLQSEFGEQYEIWVRVEDFGRSVSAGIVNRAKSITVTVLLKKGIRDIRDALGQSEIDKIRKHLTSDAMEDLAL